MTTRSEAGESGGGWRAGPRKAEKDDEGRAIYPCLWIGCEKAFGTAGHVRRHEKTHAGNTPYDCPYCDKRFGRSDVRAKHVTTIHGTKAEPESDSEDSNSNAPPSKMRRTEQGYINGGGPQYSPNQVKTPLSTSSATSDHGRLAAHAQARAQDQVGTMQPASMNMPWDHRRSTSFSQQSNSGQAMYISPPSAPVPPSPMTGLMQAAHGMMLPAGHRQSFDLGHSPNGFMDPSNLSTGPSNLSMGQGPMISGNTSDLIDPFSTNWESFGQVFGWGLDMDIDLDIGLQNSVFDTSNFGPGTTTENLSAAWLLAATPRHGSPVGEGDTEQRRDPFGRAHDNPWPNVFRPKVPDKPLTLGGVKASPRPRSDRSGLQAVGQTSRNAMLSLVYLSHQPLWLMPDIDDFPDHETLSDFVDLYFEKFHPSFPILHKPTFCQNDTPAVLLLAVAGIGATYADKEFKPLAVALDELVRRMVTWMRASDQRSKFDRQSLIAYLLCTVLGIACGSREMFLHAEISRGSLVTSRRRLNLLRPVRTAMEELLAKDRKPTNEERWKAYIEDEGKRRFGWGIYLLDMNMLALLNIPPMSSVAEINAPLPGDDALWDAPDAEVWAKLVAKESAAKLLETGSPVDLSFPRVMTRALAEPTKLPPVSDFASSIIAYTMYRFLHDDYMLRRSFTLDGESPSSDLVGTLPSVLQGKPLEAILTLSQTCLSQDTPTHLRLSAAALYHHASMQFTRPGLLERVRAASGKYEPDLTKEDSIAWLKEWMQNGKEVRKVMWHAGVLNALLGEFSKGELADFYWTFDCALVLWAVVKYGLDSLKARGLRSALFAANWFDIEPPAVWLEHGGQIVMPFLGSSSTVTVDIILKLFMDRLEMSPWGLAGQFKQVLAKLVEPEKA